MKDPVISYPKTLLLLTILAVTVIRVGGASDLYQNLDQTKTMAFTADMAINHRFVLPRDSWGEITRKPPLVNWVGLLPPSLGFWSELSLKLPSLLATFMTIWLCFWMSRRMGGMAVARSPELFRDHDNFPTVMASVAGIAYLASPSTVKHMYFLRPDMINVTCLTATWILGTLTLEPRDENHALKAIGFWVCVGVAALAKGTTAIIALIYILLAARFIHGRWSAVNRTGWYWGIPLALAVFGCWLIPAHSINPSYITKTLLAEETMSRMGAQDFWRWFWTVLSTSWELVQWFVERFAPWSVAALAGAFSIRPRDWRTHPLAPSVLWLIAVFLVFVPLEHRGGSYTMPAYPAAAPLAVYFLSAGWGRFRVPLRAQALVGMCLAVLLSFYKSHLGEDAREQAGDRIKDFVYLAAPVVANDPVAYVNLKDNPVITLMARHQPGEPDAERLAESKWIVRGCPADRIAIVMREEKPLLVSETLVDPLEQGNEVFLCLFRNDRRNP